MTEICHICQHAKIQAINDAIDSGHYLGVIKTQYKLDLIALEQHRDHRRPSHGQRGVYTFGEDLQTQEVPAPCFDDQVIAVTPEDVPKLALPYVRQAARLAGDDRDQQEQIVRILNQALQDEQMGL
jgi:hypothetical protein